MVPNGEIRYTVKKLTVVVSPLLKGKIFFVITFCKWSAFLVFRREGISYGLNITKWYHFLYSFSYSVMGEWPNGLVGEWPSG